MPDPSFLNNAEMIAGDDLSNGYFAYTNGNGQINYGTSTYFNSSNGINSKTYLYPISASSTSQILQDLNNGFCFGNYTAHGASTGWVSPDFSISDVQNLTNAHKYPLLVGNCCYNNKFDDPVCFAEALLRASNKGAIGYIGGSDQTLWDEDFYFSVGFRSNISANPIYDTTQLGAYDRIFHTHGEKFNDWYISQGQYVNAGNLAVTQSGSLNTDYYWEIYNLMGDPSLMPYFSVPQPLTVSYNPSLIIGSSTIKINTEPFAYVAISMNGILYGAKLADSLGVAVVNLNPVFPTIGNANVVITKQNRQPYIGLLSIISPNGPFVVFNSCVINDSLGNKNNIPDNSEIVYLNVNVKNVGITQANGVSAVLSTQDKYITLIDTSKIWGNISNADSLSQHNAFKLSISPKATDQHIASFILKIKDNDTNNWISNFNFKINAPILYINGVGINDSLNGNNNKILDPGEIVQILIRNMNTGHADSYGNSGILTSTSAFVNISTPILSLDTIKKSSQKNASYNIAIPSGAPIGTLLDFKYVLRNAIDSVVYYFQIPIGNANEDFETRPLRKFPF